MKEPVCQFMSAQTSRGDWHYHSKGLLYIIVIEGLSLIGFTQGTKEKLHHSPRIPTINIQKNYVINIEFSKINFIQLSQKLFSDINKNPKTKKIQVTSKSRYSLCFVNRKPNIIKFKELMKYFLDGNCKKYFFVETLIFLLVNLFGHT
jgi:hypothetical protein